MLKIGLTGSIATGKSYLAQLFRDHHIPVLDADQSVHHLYETNDELFEWIKLNFPEAILKDKINRKKLGEIAFQDPSKLKILENFIHPKVAQIREDFLSAHESEKIVILDIPLLFEKGLESQMDAVICTFCKEEIQKQRAIQRYHMDAQKLESILKSQMPQSEKVKLSDFMIETSGSEFQTFLQFKTILKALNQFHEL